MDSKWRRLRREGRTFFTALEYPIGEILALTNMVSTTSTKTAEKRAGVTVSWHMES